MIKARLGEKGLYEGDQIMTIENQLKELRESQAEIKGFINTLGMKVEETDKAIESIEGVVKEVAVSEPVEEKTLKLRLEIDGMNNLCIMYGESIDDDYVGYIGFNGQANIMSTIDTLDLYEDWMDSDRLIDETPVQWRGGCYELVKWTGAVYLQRTDISNGRIYNFTEARTMGNCHDENIIRTKHSKTPVIF